ncbi:hypothetical protein [Micromonospora carbonacea]|uniref:Uncharacterized protein n=1 Tax=Micromonospora carbonacea TaxID=47853 RepID=A0A1C5ACZ0_9ACTN|nr:hypothetical protein [Micromonospora carbonacea]SCF43029.1 hypothetical protein GA0070563_112177 [Micromonospora carbonacea]
MAAWDRSESTVRTIQYEVRDGSAVGELGAAWDAARAEYMNLNGLGVGTSLPADWATVHATDDGVAIRITVTEPVRVVGR